mmetsp:Transcript_38902/g.85511  ORF Transcript_38902/g.85511 Transcript_38902/m.85511 type:complete len:316 (-) Transcript_38902:571-1518(-)
MRAAEISIPAESASERTPTRGAEAHTRAFKHECRCVYALAPLSITAPSSHTSAPCSRGHGAKGPDATTPTLNQAAVRNTVDNTHAAETHRMNFDACVPAGLQHLDINHCRTRACAHVRARACACVCVHACACAHARAYVRKRVRAPPRQRLLVELRSVLFTRLLWRRHVDAIFDVLAVLVVHLEVDRRVFEHARGLDAELLQSTRHALGANNVGGGERHLVAREPRARELLDHRRERRVERRRHADRVVLVADGLEHEIRHFLVREHLLPRELVRLAFGRWIDERLHDRGRHVLREDRLGLRGAAVGEREERQVA